MSPERILVVGPSWVGDMVMAHALFQVLHQRRPGVVIDVLAPGWSRPLLERMPEVTGIIDMPLGHGRLELATRYRLGRMLRTRNYRQAILLPNSWKSALAPLWGCIPLRTGWVGEFRYGLLNDPRRLDKQKLTMTVQRFVALGVGADEPLPPIPPPALRVDPAAVAATRKEFGLDGEGKVLALCPGAEYGPAKRWPESHYGELARQWISQGWQVWLFGSEKDREVCAEVNRSAGGGCIDLAGRTGLSQAVDLLSCADAVVSNDSGLMHVAAALGRPLVAIYGSSDPGFTPPLNPESRVLALGLDCSPCFKRECPLGHLNCLKQIGVERVAAALSEIESKR